MNKKSLKIVLSIIGIIIISFIILVVYEYINMSKQEELLKNEVINYMSKDLEKDNYYITIKTKGDYAYIEQAIKKYYKNLSDNIKDINNYINDKNLTNTMNPKLIAENRPNYFSNHQIIKNYKNKLNKSFENISMLCDKEYIKNLLDKEKFEDYEYSYEIYKNLMYTKEDLKNLENTKIEIKQTNNNLNNMLDKMDEILVFFEVNNENWDYEDGKFYFENETLVNKYNSLFRQLSDIVRTLDYEEENINENTL